MNEAFANSGHTGQEVQNNAGPLGHITDPAVLIPYYAELKSTHDGYADAVKKIKKSMEEAEHRLAALTLHGDAQSVTLPTAKVEIQHQTVFNCKDWDAFYGWVAKDPLNRLTGFLQKRLGSTVLKAFAEEHSGALPDGVVQDTISKVKITLTN